MNGQSHIERWIRLAGLAGAVLVAAAVTAWAGPELAQLRVLSNPEGATVICDGRAYDVTPATIQGLSAGDHLVIVRKTGYREARQTVRLEAGQKTSRELAMEPVYGLVLAQSKPPGADIEIDGAHRGKTPMAIPDFPLGKSRVRYSLEGYQPREIDVTIDDRTPVKLRVVELRSDSARLRLESTPAGAAVAINGTARGETPCVIDNVPKGRVTVALALKGYRPHEESRLVDAGEVYTIAAELQPLPGSLRVFSIPEGARIYINDQFEDKAPLTIAKIDPGTYTVRAELDGHATAERRVVVARGEESTEEIRLASNTGELVIMTQPAGVDVYVDGEKVGTSPGAAGALVSEPLTVSGLPAGPHTVQFRKPGYRSSRTWPVTIDVGDSIPMKIELKRLFIPNTRVFTPSGQYDGVLLRKDENGTIELEIRPGVRKTFRKADYLQVVPIKTVLDRLEE